MVGAKECSQQIKECAIIKLVEQKKASYQRALQMIDKNVQSALKTQDNRKILKYDITFKEQHKIFSVDIRQMSYSYHRISIKKH